MYRKAINGKNPDKIFIGAKLKVRPMLTPCSAAEQVALECIKTGKFAQIRSQRPSHPCEFATNFIRAEFVRFLALNHSPVHEHGIQINGAWIEGNLDFSGCELKVRLALYACKINGWLNLGGAQIPSINLRGCSVRGVMADGLRTRGAVTLDRQFYSEGPVRLVGARIGVDVSCRESRLDGRPKPFGSGPDIALVLDGAEIGGHVFLNDLVATGIVRLVGARVRGDFICTGGTFERGRTEPEALALNRADIGGRVDLSVGTGGNQRTRFHAIGRVTLEGAKIGGDLNCSGGCFEAVDHQLAGHEKRESETALSCDHADIARSVRLNNGFLAYGGVCLVGVTIKADLDCSNGFFGATYGAETKVALVADRASVGGAVLFCGDVAAPSQNTRHFYSYGTVSLIGAQLGSSLDCRGSLFFSAGADCALALEAAIVSQAFRFEQVHRFVGQLSLSGSHVGTLVHDDVSWRPAELVLDGFSYDRIEGTFHRIDWLSRQRAADLGLQFKPQPWEQLITVLRSMGDDDNARLVAMEKQKQIRNNWTLQALEPNRTRLERFRFRWAIFWHWLYGALSRYGYRPSLLVLWAVCVGLLFTGVFKLAAIHGVMAPTDRRILEELKEVSCRPESGGNWAECETLHARKYPSFDPAIYSFDLVLPIISTQQTKDWAPLTVTPCSQVNFLGFCTQALEPGVVAKSVGYWLPGLFFWFLARLENLIGWAFGLMFVAIVSGLVKKD